MSPACRSLLEALAVTPTGTELRLLEALVGPLGGTLEECIATGPLGADGGGTLSFSHELERLTIDSTVAPDRRIFVHRLAVRALEHPPGAAGSRSDRASCR